MHIESWVIGQNVLCHQRNVENAWFESLTNGIDYAGNVD